MRWLTKILKGSSHRISKGQYHGKYEDDTIWEGPPASADQLSDFDKEELDRAIALSIAEADDKDDESQLEEDELLAKALELSWNVGSPPGSPPSSPAPPHPRPPKSPRYGYESFVPPPHPFYQPSGYRFLKTFFACFINTLGATKIVLYLAAASISGSLKT